MKRECIRDMLSLSHLHWEQGHGGAEWDGIKLLLDGNMSVATLINYSLYTMPRVTKKEKEAGKVRPKPKGAYESKNPKSTGGREGGKKTGFKVGPAHAPRDAYLGKGSSWSPCMSGYS
jgi:hypothetical protein